jgi:hypothetical protein
MDGESSSQCCASTRAQWRKREVLWRWITDGVSMENNFDYDMLAFSCGIYGIGPANKGVLVTGDETLSEVPTTAKP